MVLPKKSRLTGWSYINILKTLILLAIICVLMRGYSLPQDVTIYSPSSFTKLEGGWTQVMDEVSTPLEHIQEFTNVDAGTPIVIFCTITSDMVDQCVLFYAEHQEVFVHIADQLIYSLTNDGISAQFGTPGRTWVSIPITEDMVGQTLQLELTSSVSAYQGLPASIYSVPASSIYLVQLHALSLRNTIAFLMLFLAVASYIHALLWRPKKLRKFLFRAADLYLFVGLWLCSEVNVLAIWSGRALLSSIMAMILVRIIPVAFYQLCLCLLPYISWRVRLVGKLVWGNLFVSLLLQIVFSVSMLHLVYLNIFVITISCLVGLVEIIIYHRSGLKFLTFPPTCYCTIILFMASLVECYIYAHYQDYGHWMGLPLSLACLVYYSITYLFLVRTQSDTAEEKYRLDQTLAALNKRPLNQQINAHFLYNSLNTISAFCKEDSEQAYEAIRLLGQYMRAYTQLIGADDYVALEEELDLMHTYIAIQNMRFDNTIQFIVENNCDDVLLPPLTLQPLVENAINHGIRKRFGEGIIRINACHKYDMVEITVTDNGVGFDVKTKKSDHGVGLQNLERRINAMGGRLTVHSTPQQGTSVVLMVPIVHTVLEEQELDDFICG